MRLRSHIGVLILFLGLVTLYTWPVMRSLEDLPVDNTDDRLFTWVMLSVSHNLVTQPRLLLHGNAFYPLGNSLTFAEPLLTPALFAGPLHALTGDPVRAYKLTLLLFWALSGWAMYAVAFWLIREHAAAFVAAVIFTLSPPRIAYHVEFQMEMAFGIPLAVYTLVRFLEAQRVRYLVAFVAVFWLQAVAVWYYAVILGLGLLTVALQYATRRWAGWRGRTLAAAALGGGGLLLALAPVAWPYFVTRRELGFERGLEDIDASRYADLLTYLTTRGTWLERVVGIDTSAETTLFAGAVALSLAAMSLLWLRRADGPGGRGRAERFLAAAVWAGLALAIIAAAAGRPIRLGPVRSPFSTAGAGLLVLALARDAAEGWRRWRTGATDRRLTDRDWVGILLVVVLFAILLSLGPVVSVAGRSLGGGLYAWLYPYLLPLHAIRGATRIGLLAVFAVALLAGFGVKWLSSRLSSRSRAVVGGGIILLVLLEYATFPLRYDGTPVAPRPVDRVLRADPDDVAVLEWPTNTPRADSDAMFRSLTHGHRLVNGFAGFVPDSLRQFSGLLSTPGPPFPTLEAQAALSEIYPLRYLVVRLADIPSEWRPAWLSLRLSAPPLLRFRGTYGDEDLYEVVPQPERGVRLTRQVSYAFLRRHSALRVTLRPLVPDAGLDQWVELSLNGWSIDRLPINRETTPVVTIAPRSQAAPNVIVLDYGYRRLPAALDARYRIGVTGTLSPGDLRVRSAGQPHGDVASVRLNNVELSPNRRGYNLIALDPTARLVSAEAFDTFADPEGSGRLAQWVSSLSPGTIVAGAVKDEASARLTTEAISALAMLGVRGDLRGRFRESHAFVGVKDASPGSAVELLGPRAVSVDVGRPDPRLGVEMTGFSLTAW